MPSPAGRAGRPGWGRWCGWVIGGLVWLACAPVVLATGCGGPFPVGFRQLALADGREVAVWYPAARDGVGAAPADCPARWPLVLFSHGVAGCNEQAIYITREVARHGYMVAAPNHRDAICGVVLSRRFAPRDREPSFLSPQAWTSAAWRGRMLDLRETLRVVTDDPSLGSRFDPARIGLMGHSLGGYTVLGMAGAWPDWSLPGVRAVLAFAPFVAPYLAHHRLQGLRVPVMYQVAAWDWPITGSVLGAGGAWDASPAPKYLLELAGIGHMAWTNWPCRAYADVAACLAAVVVARRVDVYAIVFLDRYLKGAPAPLLEAKDGGQDFRARP